MNMYSPLLDQESAWQVKRYYFGAWFLVHFGLGLFVYGKNNNG
jgi:hypothetical protein